MTRSPPHQKKHETPLFNPQQINRLRIGCQHVDQLLTDIETIMNSGSSTAAFPAYISDVTPVKDQCIRDYISQMRTRLIQILKSTNIPAEKPSISITKAVSVRFTSISISVDDLRPSAMKGYGPLSQESEFELNGIVGEIQALVKQVHHVLLETHGQNITERVHRLEQEGDLLGHLSRIEDVVRRLGLVEFRGTIASILDRAEDRQFEIAVFGRVSSGKSSLLNAILETDILPVGVTPVTALPIHIAQGDEPSITISFADKDQITSSTENLRIYATEQENPSNTKRVSRISISLPSPRLQQGVGFVDTPGLGSLAMSGAAETLAYLPSADLGLVLIDAGSTLTGEDLNTILALQQAAIPIQVLISKTDLLSDPDCNKLTEYVKDQIASRCGQPYPVWPVSIHSSHIHRLEHWYSGQILPLRKEAKALKTASVQRKIDLLRQSVITTLQSRIKPVIPPTPEMKNDLMDVDRLLRQGNARIEKTRQETLRISEHLFSPLTPLWAQLTPVLADGITGIGDAHPDDLIKPIMMQYVQVRVAQVHEQIHSLSIGLIAIIRECTSILVLDEQPDEEQYLNVIREMPIWDPGELSFTFTLPVLSSLLGRSYLEKTVHVQLVRQLKQPLSSIIKTYERQIVRWSEDMIQELERTFEDTASRYRARINQMQNSAAQTTEEITAIENEIAMLRRTLQTPEPEEIS